MASTIYKAKSKVVLYPGMAGWHFISVDKKQSEIIREKHGKNRRGFGSIPIEITVGSTTWQTSIFPDKKSGTYLLPLKAQVRKKEAIQDGETITFCFTVRK